MLNDFFDDTTVQAFKSLAKDVIGNFKEEVSERYINPRIKMEIKKKLDKIYMRTLLSSLINLILYLVAVFLMIVPIFGESKRIIISSVLLLLTVMFFIYRAIRTVRNGYTIPLVKNIWKEKNIKKGTAKAITVILTNSNKPSYRMIPLFANTVDSILPHLGYSEGSVMEYIVEYCYRLEEREIIRFIISWLCISLSFFLLRSFLSMTVLSML